MAGEDLALGATSTVAPQGAQQQQAPQVLELLKRMIAQRGGQAPLEGGLVNFGSQVQQPKAPVRLGTPDISYANRPGGYQTTGERKRDEKQALFHGIASTVRTAADYMQDKKVREMSMDTERLMNAMQGYDAAKQSGDTAAAKQNADIINDMMSDPKKIKQFQKAFNVNLLGEGKDKDSPEYKGLVEAFKKYKSGESDLNPTAQKFMQSQPKTPQLSPEMQARAAAVKAKVLPTADTQVKAGVDQEKNMVDLQKIISTSSDKVLTGDRLMKIAQMRADTTDKRIQGAIDVQILKNFGSKAVADVRFAGAKYVADRHYEGIETNQKYNMLRDISKDWTKEQLAADPNLKAMDNVVKGYDRQIKELNDQMKQASKDKDTPRMEMLNKQLEAAKNVQNSVVKAYEKRIGPLEDDLQKEDESEQLSPEEMDQYKQMFDDTEP
jgi:hypothetical protein